MVKAILFLLSISGSLAWAAEKDRFYEECAGVLLPLNGNGVIIVAMKHDDEAFVDIRAKPIEITFMDDTLRVRTMEAINRKILDEHIYQVRKTTIVGESGLKEIVTIIDTDDGDSYYIAWEQDKSVTIVHGKDFYVCMPWYFAPTLHSKECNELVDRFVKK